MITFVEGELCEYGSDYLVILAGGLGYMLQTNSATISALPPIGSFLRIHSYMSVREDGVSLYGFISKEELKLFKLLIQVSGIGPKVALSILSSLKPEELIMAIASEDAKAISQAQGVGAKSAGRIILELRDKIGPEDMLEAGSDPVYDVSKETSTAAEAILALTSLGYSRSEAARAVRAVASEETEDVQELLKLALRQIM